MLTHRRLGWLCLALALLALPGVHAGKVKAQVFEAQLEEQFVAAASTSLRFENLLGAIRVRPQASGREVTIRATVISEAVEKVEARRLAQEVRLVRSETDGTVSWTVALPDARLFRMPRSGVGSLYSKWLAPLVKRNTISTRYNGRAVEVGSARGATALSVELEIELPMDLNLTVVQHVGRIDCSGIRGKVRLEIKEGELQAGRIFDSLHVMTEGASARVWGFNGAELRIETGSGKIELTEIRAETIRIDSARGAVFGETISSTQLTAATGSGDLLFEKTEAETFEITTDIGKVELATELKRTREASIRSATGDVTLRLGSFASFQLEASSEKGVVKGSGVNIEVDQFEKNEATFARGSGGAQLTVQSQSGQIVIRPL